MERGAAATSVQDSFRSRNPQTCDDRSRRQFATGTWASYNPVGFGRFYPTLEIAEHVAVSGFQRDRMHSHGLSLGRCCGLGQGRKGAADGIDPETSGAIAPDRSHCSTLFRNPGRIPLRRDLHGNLRLDAHQIVGILQNVETPLPLGFRRRATTHFVATRAPTSHALASPRIGPAQSSDGRV